MAGYNPDLLPEEILSVGEALPSAPIVAALYFEDIGYDGHQGQKWLCRNLPPDVPKSHMLAQTTLPQEKDHDTLVAMGVTERLVVTEYKEPTPPPRPMPRRRGVLGLFGISRPPIATPAPPSSRETHFAGLSLVGYEALSRAFNLMNYFPSGGTRGGAPLKWAAAVPRGDAERIVAATEAYPHALRYLTDCVIEALLPRPEHRPIISHPKWDKVDTPFVLADGTSQPKYVAFTRYPEAVEPERWFPADE
jgi:hypothetical protein